MELIQKWLTFNFKKSKQPMADFLEFSKDFKCYLNYILGTDLELVWFMTKPYHISACVRNLSTGQLANIRIVDVDKEVVMWAKAICIREMSNPKDNSNEDSRSPVAYCTLPQIRGVLVTITDNPTESKNNAA